ncbi:M23 family metallopeptidase [Bacillus kwashiorkori]|uniref:M23 family metallopeptidase n=1 Tax=Bacillus kwashiorkori TaxID=1522318 RepID=UPI0008F88F86|nr:M23 family metallopeptidase [Bacillus kwashiorkori]
MREEEKKQSSRKIGIQRFFKKQWVYPAIYIGAAAILIASVLWFQGRGNEGANPDNFGYGENPNRQIAENDSVEVGKPVENFKWPVANPDQVEIKTPFYDANASEEEQEAALISYNDNSFQPNTGIAIAAKNGEEFDVVASMSGTVKAVEDDSFLGNKIVIEHADGVVTHYQAVKDIQVKVGDKVKQGQKLATASKSMFNEEAGVHVHFEIRKNNKPLNPLEYFEKSLASVMAEDSSDANKEDEKADESEEKADESNENSEEDSNKEQEDKEDSDANDNANNES